MIKKPRDYQIDAINAITEGFKTCDRGQLILPCGAGKTLVALWIAQKMKAKRVLVLVPSLSLLKQIKDEWVKEGDDVARLCVCSENDIDGPDSSHYEINDIDGNVTTNPDLIKKFIKNNKNIIIYSTYQSCDKIFIALQDIQGIGFDLAICDEAHKTAGNKDGLNNFSMVHTDEYIRTKKRLYMTATPRVFGSKNKSHDDEYVYCMDNKAIFGCELYNMSFKEAIDRNILCDYKIIGMKLGCFDPQHSSIEQLKEHYNNYALNKFMLSHGASHIITFHSSIKKAEDFKARHESLFQVKIFHVNGNQGAKNRSKTMKDFESSKIAIVTNSRCLTEGVDVPNIDAVYFCNEKKSKIDIIQAVGRALRKSKNKKFGYIVVPILNDATGEDSQNFKILIDIVRAMGSYDERLFDYIKSKNKKTDNLGFKPLSCDGDLDEKEEITRKFDGLEDKIFSVLIDKIPTSYIPFEDAKKTVISLGINGQKSFYKLKKEGDERLSRIPFAPNSVYKYSGWISWGDFFENGNIGHKYKIYMSFEEAKAFLSEKNIKSASIYSNMRANRLIPLTLPSSPSETYATDGWSGWGDYLGTWRRCAADIKWASYEEAKELMQKYKVTSSEHFRKVRKSNKEVFQKVPSIPKSIYKDKWTDWSDFLERKELKKCPKMSFQDARNYIHSLGIKTQGIFCDMAVRNELDPRIPHSPNTVYKKEWISWPDWLGNGGEAVLQRRNRLSYEEAKEIVKPLGLKRRKDYDKLVEDGNLPFGLPRAPHTTYKNEGWDGWGGLSWGGEFAYEAVLFV